jgi:hypothetical protein
MPPLMIELLVIFGIFIVLGIIVEFCEHKECFR